MYMTQASIKPRETPRARTRRLIEQFEQEFETGSFTCEKHEYVFSRMHDEGLMDLEPGSVTRRRIEKSTPKETPSHSLAGEPDPSDHTRVGSDPFLRHS